MFPLDAYAPAPGRRLPPIRVRTAVGRRRGKCSKGGSALCDVFFPPNASVQWQPAGLTVHPQRVVPRSRIPRSASRFSCYYYYYDYYYYYYCYCYCCCYCYYYYHYYYCYPTYCRSDAACREAQAAQDARPGQRRSQWHFPMDFQFRFPTQFSLIYGMFQRIVTCPVDFCWKFSAASVACGRAEAGSASAARRRPAKGPAELRSGLTPSELHK